MQAYPSKKLKQGKAGSSSCSGRGMEGPGFSTSHRAVAVKCVCGSLLVGVAAVWLVKGCSALDGMHSEFPVLVWQRGNVATQSARAPSLASRDIPLSR
jgi:hypothetical protein